jgi:hypothetical protein
MVFWSKDYTMKRFKIFLVIYLTIGLLAGLLMAWAIPAMNVFGVLYYTLFWPMFVLQGAFGIPINWPIPSWAFTFK